MRCKKTRSNLPPEVLAVLRVSPNLEPCLRFRRARTAKFIEHIREGKCGQCFVFLRQTEKELEMMRFLTEIKN
jgi:hypothetical protein